MKSHALPTAISTSDSHTGIFIKKGHAILIIFLFFGGVLNTFAQQLSPKFINEIANTGYIHRPLPLDASNSLEEAGLKKKVLISTPLCTKTNPDGWEHSGIGTLTHTQERSLTGNGCLRMRVPTTVDKWTNSDHTTYGYSQATYEVGGANWEKYNRILFYIYPDCEGSRNVHLNLYLFNDGKLKVPDEYGREGSHEINLINRQWNKCYLEINELPRDKVTKIVFGSTAFGRDRTTGEFLQFDIDSIELQQIADPEIVSGWMPGKEQIVYSTTGYSTDGHKTAICNVTHTTPGAQKFQLLDTLGETAYQGTVSRQKTSLGTFDVIDFSDFKKPGSYRIKMNRALTSPFLIGNNIWESSVWKALNFIFCERCGYPVPEKHGNCHADILATHNGLTLPYNGGWHDAGDMSQQSLQTGDVMYALFEMANKVKGKDNDLYYRLLEEAEWGLDFVLKCRFGDGYRASSAGIAIWTDGMTGDEDDTPARVHNNPFDNFLFSGMEAYAALSIDKDKMLKEKLIKVAKEDFGFAMASHIKDGYGNFKIIWEHSYNTSQSQYMATASWAASMLYQLTSEGYYAEKATEFMNYTLDCQRTSPLNDADEISGFFYRDKSKKVIEHFNHQSREQIYMQALVALCQTQPRNPLYDKWKNAINLYGSYLKKMMKYSQPYGLIPSGIYHIDEAKDSVSFNAQNLFPGKNAVKDFSMQLQNGIKLDKEHYLKIFPVWFSFRGNTAVHLAMGKAAAICGNFLHDKELKEIAEEQLLWVVGKNPFGQSLMYGEGNNYAQQYVALPGEMVGEMPVGIQTRYNEDKPYWPQANNATYKEVWVTSAGKWLSLIADL
ncbi:glycoside hydrolase family 9 protein [uncultured Bacteroides sp.]|uniref:glycoside hydrolase family 9 protein n=1 Tax=uncultured Bacteroides sp. TaxID=162156 RepID=UPI002AA6E4D3|nr:glycoside hydrolase family 9 protein [uncultured Bacteroides sp.]